MIRANYSNVAGKTALVTLCKALAQALDAYYNSYDRETGELMRALVAWIEANM